jgi:two-component system sensor kinase FixL
MSRRQKLILGFGVAAMLIGVAGVTWIAVRNGSIGRSAREDFAASGMEPTGRIEGLIQVALGTAAVLAVAAVVPGYFVFKRFSKRFTQLRGAMDRFANGDVDIRVDTDKNDQFGQLAHAFNHMAEARKRAEEFLNTDGAKFNAMVRAIADDIALLDKDFNIIWTNVTARGIYGEDIIGKKCYEVYHGRMAPCEPYPCPTIKAFYDNKVHQYETMVKDKDGRTRYFHCVANVALRDDDGRPQAVLEICRDITERRQMEDALIESERKSSDLVQYSPDAIISLDKTGNFLSFNAAAERMTGFSAEHVLGRHFTKMGILAEESIQKALKEFGLLLTGADRSPFELVVTRRDKTRLVTETNARLIEQSERETWIQLILRDITERKRAERALDRSENLLRTIVNATKDAMIAVGEDGLINLFNPAAEKMFVREASDVIGKPLDLLIAERCKEEYHQCVKDHSVPSERDGASGRTFEAMARRKDGCVFPIELSLSAGVVDKERLVIAVLRDITERKRAERALEELNAALGAANSELIRTNKELQEFAYIAAHDLKTPLRAIGTLADWLSVDYADKFDEQGKEHVMLLVAKAKQMSALIDDVLRYSGIGQSARRCKPQQIDLNQVLSEVIAEIAPPKHVEVTVQNPLPTMTCKKTHIIQIFQNLLNNAVKHVDKPQSHIKVACIEQSDAWMFSVSDNGPGIEEKYFEKIFKLFQTLAPRRAVESTGIGLSIVKKLVELNQGKVWVESEVGKGSTFFFTLPK